MLVGIKHPGKPIEFKEIDDKLTTLQDTVEGPIDVIQLTDELWPLVAIINEEGRLKNKTPNFFSPIYNNWIVGTVIICEIIGSKFHTLSEKSVKTLKRSRIFN